MAAVELVKATLLSLAFPGAENRPAISLVALMALSSLLVSKPGCHLWNEIPTWLQIARTAQASNRRAQLPARLALYRLDGQSPQQDASVLVSGL